MLKNKEKIESWLRQMRIKNYTINDNLIVDVKGDVDISDCDLKYIPVQFGVVEHTFDCHNNQLTSLFGAPYECEGFYCHTNKLNNLLNGPQKVRGNYVAQANQLTSLVGAPLEFSKTFTCSKNPNLKDLTHLPINTECLVAYHCPLDENLFPLDVMFNLEIFYHATNDANTRLNFCKNKYEFNETLNSYELTLPQKVFASMYEKFHLESEIKNQLNNNTFQKVKL
jgi:hypothetical protein